METLKKDATERVGKFEMRVQFGRPFSLSLRDSEHTVEAVDRWNQRVEALTAWLLAEWRRERGEAA